jgi:hypothetical protein
LAGIIPLFYPSVFTISNAPGFWKKSRPRPDKINGSGGDTYLCQGMQTDLPKEYDDPGPVETDLNQ